MLVLIEHATVTLQVVEALCSTHVQGRHEMEAFLEVLIDS
jgi:hypothetical protein